MELEVTSNCHIIYNDRPWTNDDVLYYRSIIQDIIEEFHLLGIYRTQLPPTVVCYHPEYPLCSIRGEYRCLFISSESSHWAQFVFQFAHEYCHHIIDGPMDGELITSFWLEESICEMSSRYMLLKLADKWEQYESYPPFKNYSPSLRRYEEDRRNGTMKIEGSLSQWISSKMEVLSQPVYHRNLYDSIAQYLLPLFQADSNMWKLLPYLKRVSEAEYISIDHWLNEVVKPQIPDVLKFTFEKFCSLILADAYQTNK